MVDSQICDTGRDAFMTLSLYSRSKEGEVRDLGFGARNGSYPAQSRPLSETSESIEWTYEDTPSCPKDSS